MAFLDPGKRGEGWGTGVNSLRNTKKYYAITVVIGERARMILSDSVVFVLSIRRIAVVGIYQVGFERHHDYVFSAVPLQYRESPTLDIACAMSSRIFTRS